MKTFNQLVNNTDVSGVDYPFALRTARRGGNWIDVDICNTILKDCQEVFEKHGVKMWLMFGTLLGAVRDDSLIPYDRDIDVGVFRKDTLLIAEALKELCWSYGFTLIRNVTLDSIVTLMRADEYIDFYVFNECAIWYICLTSPDVCIFKDYQLDNLQTIKFLGIDFNVPLDYEKDLVMWYGDNWKVPVKDKWAFT